MNFCERIISSCLRIYSALGVTPTAMLDARYLLFNTGFQVFVSDTSSIASPQVVSPTLWVVASDTDPFYNKMRMWLPASGTDVADAASWGVVDPLDTDFSQQVFHALAFETQTFSIGSSGPVGDSGDKGVTGDPGPKGKAGLKGLPGTATAVDINQIIQNVLPRI